MTLPHLWMAIDDSGSYECVDCGQEMIDGGYEL